jgi:hypothetical protein
MPSGLIQQCGLYKSDKMCKSQQATKLDRILGLSLSPSLYSLSLLNDIFSLLVDQWSIKRMVVETDRWSDEHKTVM